MKFEIGKLYQTARMSKKDHIKFSIRNNSLSKQQIESIVRDHTDDPMFDIDIEVLLFLGHIPTISDLTQCLCLHGDKYVVIYTRFLRGAV